MDGEGSVCVLMLGRRRWLVGWVSRRVVFRQGACGLSSLVAKREGEGLLGVWLKSLLISALLRGKHDHRFPPSSRWEE